MDSLTAAGDETEIFYVNTIFADTPFCRQNIDSLDVESGA